MKKRSKMKEERLEIELSVIENENFVEKKSEERFELKKLYMHSVSSIIVQFSVKIS